MLLAPDHPLDPLGHTPDLNAPLSILGSLNGTVTITGTPGISAGFCPSLVGYDLPDVTVGSGGVHAVMSFLTGDSALWLCGDTTDSDARSYFSATSYSTPATQVVSEDLMLRLIGSVNAGAGAAYLTVNNSPGTVPVGQTEFLVATLWSSCAVQPTLYIQGVTVPGGPFVQIQPVVLATGFENGSPIADSKQGSVGDFLSDPSTGPCVPAGFQFDVQAWYLDNCSLKPNGKPRLRATNAVTVDVTPDFAACNPCLCFGSADDGISESIWKVQNPAGSRDYFNVRVGSTSSPTGAPCNLMMVTAFELETWDACGTGPSWSSIGLYDAGTTGPVLASPVALATSLTVPPGAAGLVVYDFPDVAVSTSTALAGLVDGHVAAHWPSGDTCLWMGADLDATDDDALPLGFCSTLASTSSYFSVDAYATAAVPAAGLNWRMRVDWQ